MTIKEKFRIMLDKEILKMVIRRPDLTLLEIARKFGMAQERIAAVAKANGIRRKRGKGSPSYCLKKEKWESNPFNLGGKDE